MTDETWGRIESYVLGRRALTPFYGRIPLFVSAEVADDEPQLSERPFTDGIRISPADYRERFGVSKCS